VSAEQNFPLNFVRAEFVRYPWAAGINVVAIVLGIIFLLLPSPLVFYQKGGMLGFVILNGVLSNKNSNQKNNSGAPPTPHTMTLLG
jgi:hypothetical protein